MTIRKRLVISFIFILILLSGFGIYSLLRIHSINMISKTNDQMNTVHSLIYQIQLYEEKYANTGNRNELSQTYNLIQEIYLSLEMIDESYLDKKIRSEVSTLYVLLSEFEVMLSQFVSFVNQAQALEIAIEKNLVTLDLLRSQLDKNDPIHEHLSSLLINHYSFSRNNKTIDDESFRSDIDEIEKISEHMKIENTSLEYQILGQRINSEVNQYENNLNKLVQLNIVLNVNNEKLYLQTNEMQVWIHYASEVQSQFIEYERNKIPYTFIIIFALIIIILIAVLFIYSSQMKNQVKKIIDMTQLMIAGDYFSRIKNLPKDEFGQLGDRINVLASELEIAQADNFNYSNTLTEMVKSKTLELENAKDELLKLNDALLKEKEQLKIVASTDSLTGLKTRRYIMDFLTFKIKEYLRQKKVFSVMLIDLDYFKSVNDTYGHHVGDIVLIEVAKVLQSSVRESDLVGRYGGEEFIIVFNGSFVKDLEKVTEKIRFKIEHLAFIQEHLSITMSAGIVEYHGQPIDELLISVDNLLYKAKEAGRNRVISE